MGIIAEKEIEKLTSLNDVNGLLGKKILQLFFMASNGSLCVPLAFFLSTGATGKYVHGVLTESRKRLTVREATCKTNPTEALINNDSKPYMPCPFVDCPLIGNDMRHT